MKNGNWVPISKSFLKHLPHDRAYTKMEAIYSMQCDYDDNRPVTVAGYADLWRWSRKKVALFLEHVGASIEYPENTKDKQNQKGQIRVQIRDRSGTDKGQITFIDNKVLPEEKNRRGTDKEQIRDRSGSTTIQTDTKTKNTNGKNGFKYKKKVPIPGDICLTDRMRNYVKDLGCDNGNHTENIFEKFILYYGRHGTIFKDWTLTFYSWARTDKEKYNPGAYVPKNQETMKDLLS